MIDAHRGAFEYDWRARFHSSLTVVGKSMPWGETLRLTQILLMDPSSAVGASVAGFDFPLSREAYALLDLFDLEHAKGASPKKPKPHPGRPKVRRRLDPRRQAAIRQRLREMGHGDLMDRVETLETGGGHG